MPVQDFYLMVDVLLYQCCDYRALIGVLSAHPLETMLRDSLIKSKNQHYLQQDRVNLLF
jgi:hypothetical protein